MNIYVVFWLISRRAAEFYLELQSRNYIVVAYVGLCSHLITVKKSYRHYVIVMSCEPRLWQANCFCNMRDYCMETAGHWLHGPGCTVIGVVLLFLIHIVYWAGTNITDVICNKFYTEIKIVLYCKDFEFNYLKTTCTYLT
jgi:hypothetical protein